MEIGVFHDMQGSAVSQAPRRLGQAIGEEPSLKKLLKQITKRLNLLNVET